MMPRTFASILFPARKSTNTAVSMRALMYEASEITLDEVRLRVAYCGICGTDMHEYLAGPVMLARKDERNKHTGAGLPQILGHELSGTIIEVGSDVQKFQPGQRVTVNVAMDDRHHGYDPCELCRSGRHNICAHSTFYGINAKGGGFADEIAVKAVALVPLPDNVSLKVAALAEPLSVAAHMVRTSGFRQGQDAVVLGAGPIGSAITFLLKDSGARKIIVSEVESSRAEQARLCGADRVINPAEEDALIAIKNKMGIGADVTFDACGFQVTLDTAIACTKPGGTIFNVAIHEKPLTLDMGQSPLSSFMLSTVLTCFAVSQHNTTRGAWKQGSGSDLMLELAYHSGKEDHDWQCVYRGRLRKSHSDPKLKRS